MQSAIDAAIAAYGTKTTAAGGGVSLIGLVTQSWFIGLVGLVIALMGFATNLYFQTKRDRREQREHDARMKEYE